MNDRLTDDTPETCRVRIKLVDPTGRPISGLKCQVRMGARTVSEGKTDDQGRLREFPSRIGASLSVHVEHFITGDMKLIRELKPWTEAFSVILVSGKIKESLPLTAHAGAPGEYRRKTHTVQAGDTLSAIARKHGTTAREVALLNRMELEAIIHPGQVLKLPGQEKAPPAPASPFTAADCMAPPRSAPPAPAAPVKSPGSVSQHAAALEAKAEKPQETRADVVPKTTATQDRGENGTPKTNVSLVCPGACIKLGDKGPLIEEINIRLTGFGGTVSGDTPLNVFTKQTEAAVRQFQRDYMGAKETGKMCGLVLAALDDFGEKYPVDFEPMKCKCGKCSGFGNALQDSTSVGLFKNKEKKTPHAGIEYPGIHRALFWALRAALFYTQTFDKKLEYCFSRISSGYRCWHSNAGYRGGKIREKTMTTSNHMGNALDLQFRKGDSQIRCQGKEVDFLRDEIFIKRLGAQMEWKKPNMLSLEPGKFADGTPGATAWVHVDVRQFCSSHLAPGYYATDQCSADGQPLARMAHLEKRLPLLVCGGIDPIKLAKKNDQRRDVKTLSLSRKGLEFIKGWERQKLKPYNDSQNFCTIGWGRLIAKQTCENLDNTAVLKPYEKGIEPEDAEKFLIEDIAKHEKIVKASIQVPLLQQEYDALVSLVFNTGSFTPCPKLLSKINTKDYQGCCDEFADITNHGETGLIKRRNAEIKIFRHNIYDHSH